MEVEMGGMQPQLRNAWGPGKLEEAREGPPLETLEGAQPCLYLDVGLLTSRTVVLS